MKPMTYKVEVDNYGTQRWYVDGRLSRLSRLDGPAVVWNDGTKQWWVDGKQLSEKAFQKHVNNLKNPASCAGKVVRIEGRKYKLVEV